MGSHTQSAGTREIALRSGGDSLRVDDSYALQDTLARIRQRYALNFYLPAGVRPGEERYAVVQLADATLNRYPGADVRYRQSYFAPTGSTAPAPATDSPVVVSRAGSNDSNGTSNGNYDPDRPVMRRRPAVSQPDSGGAGPLIRDSGSETPAQASSSQPASPTQPPPSSQPQAAPVSQSPTAPSSSAPGWRTARPEDTQH